MSKILTDLSQLTKDILHRDEPSPTPKPARVPILDSRSSLSREDADCLAYFSRTSITDPRASALADAEAARAHLAADLAATRAELDSVRQALAAAEQAAHAHADAERAWHREKACLESELHALRTAAVQAPSAAAAPAPVVPTPPPTSPRVQKDVFAPPAAFDEAFPGELREQVLATLAEDLKAARQSGRERRAAALDAMLSANHPTGELSRRRAALKQILKDAGFYTDPRALESLGFKLIGGRTHWKLEYAGIRMTIAKTPSDYRSNLNATSEMANRCF